MLTPGKNAVDLAALGGTVEGELVRPDDESWNSARQAWNLAVDQRPEAVLYPAGPDDVSRALACARNAGLGIAIQGTGHGAAPGTTEGSILLNMARLRGVEIDTAARTARVEAGALWGEVVDAAFPHGLTGLAGSARDVGVVGYTLGGGLGWLARRYGLAANSVRTIDVVTADGELRRADPTSEPELFWALRGGGGSFAVVTALELDLYPVSQLYAGTIWWPFDRAWDVFATYLEWVETVPDELTSLARILHVPPLPFLPEEIRGKSFAVVEAAYLGPEEEGVELLSPVRGLGGAVMDTFATIPVTALGDLHNDPPGPEPAIGAGMVLGELPEASISALVGAVPPSGPVFSVELRHLGGALADAKPSHGALPSIEGRFASYAVGMVVNPEVAGAMKAQLGSIAAAMAPWATGNPFLNFQVEFSGSRRARLAEVKAAYDPEGIIRSSHPIDPAG